ncbi:insulin-like growth factor-binding protein complex acid labile subunit [Mytilus californianus]|uniref:insulin-like growth factor-binding protein complex acid labile subunit n=1 Tax=Mytilus californianus TaxID=6549 RepID=UPI0022480E99|nr:insulin-like growth factor-binding protein complex acid labile subunit [Mytilus californianus]
MIERIPTTTFNNTSNLFELNLSWNRLVYLQEGTFDGLQSLQKLFLNGNYLNYIKINLSHNKFTDVTIDLSHLVNLERLDLSYNNISAH